MPGLANIKDYNNIIKLLDNDDKSLNVNNNLSEISRKMYHVS